MSKLPSIQERLGKGGLIAAVVLLGLVLVAGVATQLDVFSGDAGGEGRGDVDTEGTRTGRVQPGSLAGANVLLITVDTLRADVLGAYGGDQNLTPNLDRLAASGVRFDAAFAHAPMTLPSHASILTGQFPFRHGVRANGTFRLAAAQVTLAEVLRDAGYRTGAFVGAFVLDVRFGLDQGFDHYDDLYGEQQGLGDFRYVERRAGDVLEPALTWIEQQDGPWFAWVHLFDPHAPYDAPESFQRGRRTEPYRGEVAYVDHEVGVFLDRLDGAGLRNDLVIAFTADHGESLGEHGEQTHGAFAYNATLQVPLLFHAGERLPAAVRTETVGHVDILPTLVQLVGLEVPAAVQGRPLLSSTEEPADSGRAQYFEALDGYYTQGLAPLSGIVDDDRKFVDLPVRELYDLGDDPDEQRNLADTAPEVADRYRERLERLLGVEGVPAGRSPILDGLAGAAESPVDSETRDRLATLGYLAPAPDASKRTFTAADDPKNAIATIEKQRSAAAMFAEGRPDEAIALLREVLRERPDSVAATTQLAAMLESAGSPAQALEVLETAAERRPGDAAVAARRGRLLVLSGDPARAAALLQSALETAPDNVELLESLAIAHATAGRGQQARRLLERVLEIDPTSASAHYNIGLTQAEDGAFAAALESFEEAVRLAPGFWRAHEATAGVLSAEGRMEEAVEAWKDQLEAHPAGTDAAYNAGVVLADLGRHREALVCLERFIASAPEDDPDLPAARRLAITIRDSLRRHP